MPKTAQNWFEQVPNTNAPFYFQLRDADGYDTSELIGAVKIDYSKYKTAANQYPEQVIIGRDGFRIKLDFLWL